MKYNVSCYCSAGQ